MKKIRAPRNSLSGSVAKVIALRMFEPIPEIPFPNITAPMYLGGK